MPLEYTAISELNSSKKEWKIRVLVSRMWEYFSKNKPEVVLGLEVILLDEKVYTLSYLKIFFKVADHIGSTSFLLFDREVIQFIHKSAYELLEQQVQTCSSSIIFYFNREREIPQELMDLEGRKIIWIICVKGTEKKIPASKF
ncbi:unnamed protein product [Brassica oleracea]